LRTPRRVLHLLAPEAQQTECGRSLRRVWYATAREVFDAAPNACKRCSFQLRERRNYGPAPSRQEIDAIELELLKLEHFWRAWLSDESTESRAASAASDRPAP